MLIDAYLFRTSCLKSRRIFVLILSNNSNACRATCRQTIEIDMNVRTISKRLMNTNYSTDQAAVIADLHNQWLVIF